MNNSVSEKEKAVVSTNVSNTEKDTKDVITLSNGDKVDKTTGEVLTNDSKKDEKTNPTTCDLTLPPAAPTENKTATEEKKEDEKPKLTVAEKENLMREEVLGLGLENLDVKLMYEMMSVPTYSNYEYRMVTYLILWARKNNIEHKFDDYGNLYFIKGKPKEGEFYPCVTAHLDTVQDKAKAYVLTGAELDLRTRKNTKGEHEVYIDGMGTGSDDKNAILIALHMFRKFDTLKGAFFLGEEIGCQGSTHMDEKFFNDVSYVIGFDSPEKNRAAWRLMGRCKMFTADFYKKYMKPVCDKHGMTKFFSESYTDELHITEKTGLTTMNFGNAGYLAHSQSEYFNIEELDDVIAMGNELVETIPTNVQHMVKTFTWEKDPITGNLKRCEKEDNSDETYLKSLGDDSKYNYYSGYNYGGSNYSNGGTYSSGSSTNMSDGYWDKNKDKDKDDDKKSINEETLEYIVDIYDSRIEEIENGVKNKCKELGIDFDEFSEIFSKEIKF